MITVETLILPLAFLFLLLLASSLAWGAVSAAPWVPLKSRDLARLLALAELKASELVYDLGCGDGRIVVARLYGVRAIGFEVAILPYCLAKLRVLFSGTGGFVKIRYKNFWSAPFNQADVVFCFLTPSAMARLEEKLDHELKPGARFITYAFKLPHRSPTLKSQPTANDLPIYLYT